MAACGADDSDDTSIPTPGVDGGGVDGSATKDGSVTTPPVDSGTPSKPDTGTTPDATADAALADAATPDADADVPDADAGTTDGGVTVDPTAFCTEFPLASYSFFLTCCAADDGAPVMQFLRGFAGLVAPQCVRVLNKSLADGRVVYDAAKDQSCLTAVRTTTGQCPAVGPGALKKSDDCELVFRGIVAEGGTCTGDHECVTGLACQGTTCKKAATVSGGACDYPTASDNSPGVSAERTRCIAGEDCYGSGQCVPHGQVDDDCAFDYCADGLYCQRAGAFDWSCQVLVPGDAGATCDVDVECNDDLYCNETGTCTAKKSVGAACTDTNVNGAECKGYCDDATKKCVSFCGSN